MIDFLLIEQVNIKLKHKTKILSFSLILWSHNMVRWRIMRTIIRNLTILHWNSIMFTRCKRLAHSFAAHFRCKFDVGPTSWACKECARRMQVVRRGCTGRLHPVVLVDCKQKIWEIGYVIRAGKNPSHTLSENSSRKWKKMLWRNERHQYRSTIHASKTF